MQSLHWMIRAAGNDLDGGLTSMIDGEMTCDRHWGNAAGSRDGEEHQYGVHTGVQCHDIAWGDGDDAAMGFAACSGRTSMNGLRCIDSGPSCVARERSSEG